ncbi:peptidoglycan recognition family protein [Actinobaculum sp. 352]|uniref:peptidoglycan recognition protein family protein n=1 Tax=Actinobaculum sp. 352 TaxID=2490946 RepID=UPI001F49A712|nr:peptidoglycan recognition family protein [Actinobaculum sp. 352]
MAYRHTPTRLTLHTAVSSAVDLYKGRPDGNGLISHFYVNRDGVVYQYRDTQFQAWADYQGNAGSISVETWDGAQDVAWTEAQIAALADLYAWAYRVHDGLPNRLATVSDVRGLAWHRLGCTGNFGGYDPGNILTWSGNQTGLVWSRARGKVCPRDVRIRQIPEIYRRAQTGQATTAAQTTGVASAATLSDIEEVIEAMKATHVIFTYGSAICIADILAGTWRKMPDTQTYNDTLAVLKRTGAKVAEWRHFAASKSNTVANPRAFGAQVEV